jgi:hypothetical protein
VFKALSTFAVPPSLPKINPLFIYYKMKQMLKKTFRYGTAVYVGTSLVLFQFPTLVHEEITLRKEVN